MMSSSLTWKKAMKYTTGSARLLQSKHHTQKSAEKRKLQTMVSRLVMAKKPKICEPRYSPIAGA